VETDTLAAAREAAENVEGVRVEGTGATADVDREVIERSLAAFALCARRHGAVPDVTIAVDGRTFRLSPIGPAAPILLGEELRDIGAAVAVRAIQVLGGSVAVDGDSLVVTV
jgi:hypothetical protein